MNKKSLIDYLLHQVVVSACLILAASGAMILVIWFDVAANHAVTARSIVTCLAIVAAAAVVHVNLPKLERWAAGWKFRRDHRRRLRDPLRHLGRRQDGFSDLWFLVISVLCFVCVVLIFCINARAEGDPLEDALLAETGATWPKCALEPGEYRHLLNLIIEVTYLHKSLSDSPPEVGTDTRNLRHTLRRKLEEIKTKLIEMETAHVLSVLGNRQEVRR